MPAIDVEGWRRRIRETTFASYHYEMGVAIEREGSAGAAADSYRRALLISPELGEASFRLARLLDGVGRPDEAEGVRRAARAIAGQFELRAIIRIVCALLDRDDGIVEALTLLDEARATAPADPDLACLIDLAHRLSNRVPFDEVVSERPDGLSDEVGVAVGGHHMRAGIRHLGVGDRAAARFRFASALAFDPDLRAARHNLAIAQYQSGDVAEAVDTLLAVPALPDTDVPYLTLLGDGLMALNRSAEAEPIRRRLSQLRPLDPMAHKSLGDTAMALGRFEDAVESFRAGMELSPQSVDMRVGLGFAFLGLDRPDEAEPLFRLATQLCPADRGILFHHGAALHALGRYAEAEAVFLDGQTDAGAAFHPLAWVALSRLGAGALDGAADASNEDSRTLGASPWGSSVRALVQHARGEHAAALASHRAALDLAGEAMWYVAWIQGNMAVTLDALGDRPAAHAAIEAAERAAPAWIPYQQRLRPSWARTVVAAFLSAPDR